MSAQQNPAVDAMIACKRQAPKSAYAFQGARCADLYPDTGSADYAACAAWQARYPATADPANIGNCDQQYPDPDSDAHQQCRAYQQCLAGVSAMIHQQSQRRQMARTAIYASIAVVVLVAIFILIWATTRT